MKNRVFNFSAGPATLPEDILNEIKDELLDFNGIGSSIIEISHRDKIFIEVAQNAEHLKLVCLWQSWTSQVIYKSLANELFLLL